MCVCAGVCVSWAGSTFVTTVLWASKVCVRAQSVCCQMFVSNVVGLAGAAAAG